MTIRQTSDRPSSQIIPPQLNPSLPISSPAKVAGEVAGLREVAYYPFDKPSKLEKSPKEYADGLEGFDPIPGYFNFYRNKDATLMEINSDQIGKDKVFLMSAYRITEFSGQDNMKPDAMMGNFPVYFKEEGDLIQLYIKNLDNRSNDKYLSKAVSRSKNDILLSWAKKSATCKGKILFDLKDLIVTNLEPEQHFTFFAPPLREKYVKIDAANSSLEKPKSFKGNSELTTTIVYAPNKDYKPVNEEDEENVPLNNAGITYNISFSARPSETNNPPYMPRQADDAGRVGHFTTKYNKHDSVVVDGKRKVEYIQRWNLGKIDPVTKKPEKPIVFWIANTIPPEYRDAVEKGIKAWNISFEKIGIKDAIEVHIQPDNADWDPSDIRYNTVNFVRADNPVGAMGPSMVDPFTGEIYAADILINYDMLNSLNKIIPWFDNNYNKLTDEKTKKDYIANCLQGFLTSLTFHEVGHTLGLAHNFKGSLKSKDGVPYSVMDYNPEDDGAHQTKPGVYDNEAIKIAYKPKPPYIKTPEEEKKWLDGMIAELYTQDIPFGNDEEAWLGIDPSCNMHDSGNPLEYCRDLLKRVRAMLGKMEKEIEKPGADYETMKKLVTFGLLKYSQALDFAYKYIGGVYHLNAKTGDLKDRSPYEPVPAKEQKEALKFLLEEALSGTAIVMSPKLEKELNFNIKDFNKNIQNEALNTIFQPEKIKRIADNEEKYAKDPFKLSDLFESVDKNIWAELDNKENIIIGKTKRDFLTAYIKKLSALAKGPEAMPQERTSPRKKQVEVPADTAKFAQKTLSSIQDKVEYVLQKEEHKDIKIDADTLAFLKKLLPALKGQK